MAPKQIALAFAAVLYRAEVIDGEQFRRLTDEINAIPAGDDIREIHRSTMRIVERAG